MMDWILDPWHGTLLTLVVGIVGLLSVQVVLLYHLLKAHQDGSRETIERQQQLIADLKTHMAQHHATSSTSIRLPTPGTWSS